MTKQTDVSALLGKNLRRLRLQKNLTQDALAELLGISVISLSQVENSRTWPRRELMQKIVEVLDVRPFELFVEDIDDIDHYKALIISAFANEIDSKFPTETPIEDLRFNISHSPGRQR